MSWQSPPGCPSRRRSVRPSQSAPGKDPPLYSLSPLPCFAPLRYLKLPPSPSKEHDAGRFKVFPQPTSSGCGGDSRTWVAIPLGCADVPQSPKHCHSRGTPGGTTIIDIESKKAEMKKGLKAKARKGVSRNAGQSPLQGATGPRGRFCVPCLCAWRNKIRHVIFCHATSCLCIVVAAHSCQEHADTQEGHSSDQNSAPLLHRPEDGIVLIGALFMLLDCGVCEFAG